MAAYSREVCISQYNLMKDLTMSVYLDQFFIPRQCKCNDLLFLSKLKNKQEMYSYHVRIRKLALT